MESGLRRNIMTGSSSFSSCSIKRKSTRGPESASRSAGRSSNATVGRSGWRRRPNGGLFSISRSKKGSEKNEDQANRKAGRNLVGGRFPRRCPPDEGGPQRGEDPEPSSCRGGRRGGACLPAAGGIIRRRSPARSHPSRPEPPPEGRKGGPRID